MVVRGKVDVCGGWRGGENEGFGVEFGRVLKGELKEGIGGLMRRFDIG